MTADTADLDLDKDLEMESTEDGFVLLHSPIDAHMSSPRPLYILFVNKAVDIETDVRTRERTQSNSSVSRHNTDLSSSRSYFKQSSFGSVSY